MHIAARDGNEQLVEILLEHGASVTELSKVHWLSCGSPVFFCYFFTGNKLKGLGDAILGNFGTYQMVIELVKYQLKITAQNYRRALTKHRKAKKGRGWIKLERIEMDCIWVNLKSIGPPFFKFTASQFIHVSKFH